ncbi:hypothetical protein [Mycolicibacterium vaccae]|jgi:hypothetical protein|uniref:hypothetical protein n=1 Tax=Mycolicibacterium vaccae TaxID=1810 RepID=UPI0002D4D09E|nr:hypothetical protein [Mycolicibacterium vaccae]
MRHITEVTMMKSGNGPEDTDQDPDADPEMKTSGTAQPDQAEGEDDPGETGN